jgi:hypothetical protein
LGARQRIEQSVRDRTDSKEVDQTAERAVVLEEGDNFGDIEELEKKRAR